MSILVVDNFDSFVHNLARYLRLLGVATEVLRPNEIDISQLEPTRYAAVVISPGPGTPKSAHRSIELVHWALRHRVPMLGVCLGLQVMVHALGGRVSRADKAVHGQAAAIHHTGHPLFQGIKSGFLAARYHSLVADPATLPSELEIVATADDGTVMAVAHRTAVMIGVQFHPESVLTECGLPLLRNFLTLAGITLNEATADASIAAV